MKERKMVLHFVKETLNNNEMEMGNGFSYSDTDVEVFEAPHETSLVYKLDEETIDSLIKSLEKLKES